MSISTALPAGALPAGPRSGRPITRWKAAGIHLGLSALIAGALLALLLLVWYPASLFKAQGGDTLLFLLVGVDVAIGPLLTLVVFKAGKKGLKLDLAVIGVLQLAALAYGSSTAFQARPVFIAFQKDWFEVIPANGIEADALAEASRPEFGRLSLTGPRLVATRMPTNPDEEGKALVRAIAGYDITYFPKYYLPYEEAKAETLPKSRPIADLRKLNPAEGAAIDRFLAAHGRNDQSARYLPVKTRIDFVTAFVDAQTGEFLGLLGVVPW